MKTILAADDSTTIRQMVEFSLKDAGYNVVLAHDGSSALSRLKSTHVDVLITDLNMPGIDGIELIRLARALPAHRFTPILMLTTESAPEKKRAGQSVGATGWIVKPFQPAQLAKVVQRVLGG